MISKNMLTTAEVTFFRQKEYTVSGNEYTLLDTKSYGYDTVWKDKLANFDGISYTCNKEGIRTSKTSNGITTRFFLTAQTSPI